MNFRSEIRPSTINSLLEKAAANDYGKYLRTIRLRSIRAFSDEVVTLDFPVTAIVGPNGGGKTTILGAAACAYKSVKPQQFFAKSGKLDESMQNWELEYELVDRDINPRDIIRRTAGFKNMRWRRGALPREVVVFGVARTVPANERVELRKCASTAFEFLEEHVSDLDAAVAQAVGAILGKDVSEYKHIRVDAAGRVTLLTGRSAHGDTYSEFHFGAGESSVIRMVMRIEALPEQSLVLIEEVENGLHPLATARMVEYLIDVADRKRVQAIFTSHSNDSLRPLPAKAIWAAMHGRAFQGKLDIRSLRAITGEIEAEIAVFVEDQFAKTWLEAAIRHSRNVAIDRVEIHPMEGDGTAVKVNEIHNQDPAVDRPSVCFVDGDSRQDANDEAKVFKLPGGVPESYVFDRVMERFDEWGSKLVVALHQPYETTDEVREVLQELKQTNRDPHLLYGQIGERLRLIPETTVQGAFANIWAEAYPDEVETIVQPIESSLPREATMSPGQPQTRLFDDPVNPD